MSAVWGPSVSSHLRLGHLGPRDLAEDPQHLTCHTQYFTLPCLLDGSSSLTDGSAHIAGMSREPSQHPTDPPRDLVLLWEFFPAWIPGFPLPPPPGLSQRPCRGGQELPEGPTDAYLRAWRFLTLLQCQDPPLSPYCPPTPSSPLPSCPQAPRFQGRDITSPP